ncbi:MAG: DHH family phosphoesterase [Spirochaetota bacterium]
MYKPVSIPQELLDAFQQYTRFVIIGHEHPDSDSIHSQMAMGKLFELLGKKPFLVSTGPFTRQEIAGHEELFHTHLPEGLDPADTLIVIVDCSSADRIGYLAEEIAGFTIAVIDHHASGQAFGNIHFIDDRAFSVTFLIHRLFNHLKLPIDPDTAHMLLFGLATDTGYFRHIGPYRGEVFQTASELVHAGASPRDIHADIYGQKSFESRKLLGVLLARMEQDFDGRLIYTWETLSEIETYGELNRDSETLYTQMLSVYDCEVIIYIRENRKPEGTCTVGLRTHSNSSIDVGALAAEFGGGGHRKAAGATVSGSIEEILPRFKKRLDQEFS